MKVLFTHLLNNYTGSPKVLSAAVSALAREKDFEITLLTSRTDGVLNGIPNVRYCDNGYRWKNCRPLLAVLFVWAQVRSFFFVLFHRFDVVYVNTVLPFGAALAAKLRREKIIYHVHEVYIKPNIFKRFSCAVMRKCADRILCVSRYVQENVRGAEGRSLIVYNPVERHEVSDDVEHYVRQKFDGRMIFMPTSLKEYKGVNQFAELARRNADFHFVLLCSVPLEEIQAYFFGTELPQNLALVGRQKRLLNFYREAAVTMNLSLQDKFIETFGLTIPEGFDALTPAVAPAFGGPTEIIEDGKNGFLVNPYDLAQVEAALRNIMANFETYSAFALAARESLSRFAAHTFCEKIKSEICEVAK